MYHDGNRDLKHRQRNALRRRLQPKEDWVEGFVLRLVALATAFKNVRNLLLINHNDGFIDDDELICSSVQPLRIEKPRLSVWFVRDWPGRAWWVREFCRVSLYKTRYTNSEGSSANPWHDYLQSALSLWWTRRSLYAVEAAFIPMQIWIWTSSCTPAMVSDPSERKVILVCWNSLNC